MPFSAVSPHCELPVPAGMGDWPLRSHLALGPLPSAVPCVRLHARHILCEWGLRNLTESVELLVSELTTNAIAATRATETGLPVRFWMLSDRKQVLILVCDANPNPPMRMDPSGDMEHGRGLMLVEAISTRWGSYAVADSIEGKAVWALIAG